MSKYLQPPSDALFKNVERENRRAETGRSTRRVVRLKKGEAWRVRFLPARLTAEGNFFACVAKHWLYKRPILCLRGTDEIMGGNPKIECPVCATLEELEGHHSKEVSDFAWRVQVTPQWLTFCSVMERVREQPEPMDEVLNPYIFEHYRSTFQELVGFFRNGVTKKRPWSVLDYLDGNDFIVRKGRTTRLDKMDPEPIISTDDEGYLEECIKILEGRYKLPKQNIPNEAALNHFVQDIWEAIERLEEGEDARDVEDDFAAREEKERRGRGRDDEDDDRRGGRSSRGRDESDDRRSRGRGRSFDEDEDRDRGRDRGRDQDRDQDRGGSRGRSRPSEEPRARRSYDDEEPRRQRRETEDQGDERPTERRRAEPEDRRAEPEDRRSAPEDRRRPAAPAAPPRTRREPEPEDQTGGEEEPEGAPEGEAETDAKPAAEEREERTTRTGRSPRREGGRIDDESGDEVPPEEKDSAPPAAEDDIPYDDPPAQEDPPPAVTPPARPPQTRRPAAGPSSVVPPTTNRPARTGSPVPPPPARKPGTALLNKISQRGPE
jgi:hypothetical protein